MPRPDWVVEFDARGNAEAHVEQIAEDIRNGRKGTLTELSLPAGGSYDVFEAEGHSHQEKDAQKAEVNGRVVERADANLPVRL